MLSMILMNEGEGAWNGITSGTFLTIFDEIKSLIPIVAPAVVGFLGFRKAWGFLRSAIAGA